MNLSSNAIKFTPNQGVILLQVAVSSLESEKARIAFFVRDTGIGIPKEKQDLIFHPFSQADASTTRRFGGTGLGLTIAQKLVRLMGAELEVRSQPSLGSVFFFEVEFPVAEAPKQIGPGPSSPEIKTVDTAPLNILVAEDNLINQKLISRILEKAGHTICLASNGEEALRAYKQGDFDLVLMDIQMPVKSGLEAVAGIRMVESETGRAKVPIVALTAHALEGDRERFLSLGMDGYIAKPIEREELFRVIKSYQYHF
jgi:CheY-like chemotaxis protein